MSDIDDAEEAQWDEGHAAGVAEERARIDKLFAEHLADFDEGTYTYEKIAALREWVTRSATISRPSSPSPA